MFHLDCIDHFFEFVFIAFIFEFGDNNFLARYSMIASFDLHSHHD